MSTARLATLRSIHNADAAYLRGASHRGHVLTAYRRQERRLARRVDFLADEVGEPSFTLSYIPTLEQEIPMQVMTKEVHAEIDPDHTCPRCLALKARMRDAAETASAVAVDRFGKPARQGSAPWRRAYHAALSAQ